MMRIVVTADPDSVVLHEPDDFTSFSVEAPAATALDLGTRIHPVGHRDGDHVWVDRSALTELAGAKAEDPTWREGLAAMAEFARSHGFLSEDGSAIRAHIEWVEP